MICSNCGNKFPKEDNRANKTNGDIVVVCPNCGKEEVEKSKITFK